MHPRVSLRSSGSTRSVVSALPLCILILSLGGSAQEKPREGPAAEPRKQTQRQPATAARTEAQRDSVEQHYRAAETFQLANDLRAAETEYRSEEHTSEL